MFSRKPNTEETWELVRGELRRLRGQKLLRSREEQFPDRNELILYDEPGRQAGAGCWIISIPPDPRNLTATHRPSGEMLSVESDLSTLMETIASRLRGTPYLRTKAKGTEYR